MTTRSARRSVLLVLLAAASFAGVAAALRPLMPVPESHYLRAKLEHYAEHRDEYDLVFLGSSRVYHSFVCDEVDARLADEGLDVRSFNLGVDGMQSFEADRLLEDVLALGSERLEWVVIEWPQWEPGSLDAGDAFTDRAVRWHTLGRTLAALGSVARADVSTLDRLRLARRHLLRMLASYANLGAAAGPLRPDSFHEVERERVPEILAARGFAASRPGHRRLDPAEVRARLEAFLANLPRLARANEAAVDPADYNRAALDRQLARLDAAGVRVVYVTLPGRVPAPHAYRLRREGFERPLVLLNDPVAHGPLYEADLRVDTEHLNLEGALEVSRVLARELAPILRAAR